MELRVAIAAVLFSGTLVAPASASGFGGWCYPLLDNSASRVCPEDAWGYDIPGPERCEGRNGPFFEYDENGIVINVYCTD